MDVESTIQNNIQKMQEEMGEDYWNTSASQISLLPEIISALQIHSHGKLLDAGAGNLLYRDLLNDYCDDYRSLDIIDNDELDYRQDIQDTDIPNNQFDTIFCRNVLEHVPYPRDAINEIGRMLRSGGKAIITVPHLAYLHNEPHDYYRYTSHGIEQLAEDAGLEVISIREVGGMFSFLGYSISTLLLGLTYDKSVSIFTIPFNNTLQKNTC